MKLTKSGLYNGASQGYAVSMATRIFENIVTYFHAARQALTGNAQILTKRGIAFAEFQNDVNCWR